MNRLERLMRSDDSLICGVASGMANRFGWSKFWTRIVWAFAIFSNPVLGLLAYFALAIVEPDWIKRY
ncbi:PspC domain-containing protein [Shewanella gelidii]|uniref:PspC domain-containing protein n=1 Tax=Shewanella gelidii TaxID=1642821 RepID=A0A917JSG4_9GAMM|nr:PspC domain-containing protein [Shewanella gelidii]MCL1097717.1 PspC domain-containing protein [Shewanella gelidii]GGI79323.1 PspC domain-containing protein [Shewanella gelidii]